MKRRFLSTLRRSRRVMRLGLSGAIFGLVLTGTPPPLAQALVPATLKSSAYTAKVLIGAPLKYAQTAAQRTARRAVRLTHDAQRKIRNARVPVNKTKPTVTKANLEVAFGADVTTETLRRARFFAEPLVPTAEPSADDNRAVARLLENFANQDADMRALRIEQFLTSSPTNPWRASILANAGTVLARSGYYSRAAAYWQQAWELTRDHSDRSVKAIADYALGEGLSQMVTFGQKARIAARLKEAEGRDVRGPAGVKVAEAREAWATLTLHHQMATFSGPEALKMYLTVAPTDTLEESVRTISAYHPKPEGTSLVELRDLAAKAKLPLEMVHTRMVTEIPVPSVIHLRSEHFAAVIKHENGKYQLRDPSLGGTLILTEAALRDEASGYFLVSQSPSGDGWSAVSAGQAASVLGHCTPGKPSNNDRAGPPGPNRGNCGCGGAGPGSGGGGGGGSSGPGGGAGSPPGLGPQLLGGMPYYAFHALSGALIISDTPLGYDPPIGESAVLELSYNHRDDRQPQTFGYGHVGPLWTWTWLSYVTDNITLPDPPYEMISVYLRGAGMETYSPFDAVHQLSRAELVQVTETPIRYERRLPDGTVEVFDEPDRAATLPNRRIFLTEVIDPQGHSLEFTYDSSFRLVALTDALGQVTELDYDDSADPLRLTKVTDPFGREATLTYDAQGRLATITDVMGMTSHFTYGAGDFITVMTTPYGTTTFRHEPDPTQTAVFRRIEATDPMGGTERLEFHIYHDQLPATVSSGDVPTGFSASNNSLNYWNSLYWNKRTMAVYGADLSKAYLTNWMLAVEISYGHAMARYVPHSVKPALENRIWFRYPDQQATWHHAHGTGRSAAKIGRVLEGGASQVTEMSYNSLGMVTSRKDPLGRETTYTYDSNDLDLLEVRQVVSSGTDLLAAYDDYTSAHQPETTTDAAGEETTITYNSAGQVLTVTNALEETTTYTYDSETRVLETVTGPVSGTTTTYVHDASGRVETITSPDGYVVTLDYDLFDRVTRRTYPDDTYDESTFDRLRQTQSRDRLGRLTRYFYDPEGRLTSTRDPAGRTITQVWCACGSLDALIDANGNRTSWERDAQGRVTREVRADGTTDTLYTYDATGRLRTITDPKDQVTTHVYNVDDSLAETEYTEEEHETPNVSFTYETYYPRTATMVDGIGTTSYTYKAAGTLGAGQVASIDWPRTDDTIAYTYDELGRVVARTINGSANEVTWTFDEQGRVTSEDNALGLFEFTYDGVTNRIETVTYPNDQTSEYTYLDDEDDFRLQTIHHKYPNSNTLSKFDYTYDAAGNILTWQQQADSTAVLWEYGYDMADQLTRAVTLSTANPPEVLKRYAYAYDPAGNRTVEQIDDAVTLSSYDNLNRLTSQAPGGPMVIAGTLNEPGTVTIQGVAAAVDSTNAFRGTVPTTTGTTTFTIVARDYSGNQTTQQYEVDVAGSGRTFTHDADGNLTADGQRTFEWSARNQLVAVNVGTVRSEFAYAGLQQRAQLVVRDNGVIQSDTLVIWCDTRICEERGGDGTTVTRRVFRLGEQLTATAQFFVADHLGSIGGVTDASGGVLARYDYDPWGRGSVTTGTDVTDVGFTGHHTTTGATWLAQYRVYDPETGRWASQDPIGLRAGPNMMAYVNNNPVNAVDPLGLQSGYTFPPPLVQSQPLPGTYPRPNGACCDPKRREEAIRSAESQRARMRRGLPPVGRIAGSTETSASCDPRTGWCTPWPPGPQSQFDPGSKEEDPCVYYCIAVHEWTHWNDRRRWRLSWTDNEMTIHREWPAYDSGLKCLMSFR